LLIKKRPGKGRRKATWFSSAQRARARVQGARARRRLCTGVLRPLAWAAGRAVLAMPTHASGGSSSLPMHANRAQTAAAPNLWCGSAGAAAAWENAAAKARLHLCGSSAARQAGTGKAFARMPLFAIVFACCADVLVAYLACRRQSSRPSINGKKRQGRTRLKP